MHKLCYYDIFLLKFSNDGADKYFNYKAILTLDACIETCRGKKPYGSMANIIYT